ncbi:Ubiquitin--protein ligase [Bertholletia excelsa]
MSTAENPDSDIESRFGRSRRRRRFRSSVARNSEATTDGSICFSDSDSGDPLGRSPEVSRPGGSISLDEHGLSEIEGVTDPRIESPSSLSKDFDLESGEVELKVNSGKEQKGCRICHLNLEGGGGGDGDSQLAMELGCSCKGDLAAAHKQCAETWFKIRGNTICEICGARALNVAGEQQGNEANGASESGSAVPAGPEIRTETRNFWVGRRVMNILLVCMVVAFAISWLFHFNLLS